MRRTVLRIVLIVLALVIAAGAYGWWYLAIGRFPLRGDLSHDFGTVEIYGRSASVDHTFRLRNHTDRPITIERIIPGCGCTDIVESTRDIAPGETVDIDTTLTLSKSGKKKADITLMLADFGPQRLFVYAKGRKEFSLWASGDIVRLTPGEPMPVTISVYVLVDDDEPDAPTIEAPEGVSAEFVNWSLVQKRNKSQGRAAQWRGLMTLELKGEPLPADAKLRVGLGKAQPWEWSLVVENPAPPGEATQGDV